MKKVSIISGVAKRQFLPVSQIALKSEKLQLTQGLSCDCDGDCGQGDCDCSSDCDD